MLVSNATRDFSTEAEYMPVNKLLDVVEPGPYKVTVSVVSDETGEEISKMEGSKLTTN